MRGIRAGGSELPLVLFTYLNPVYGYGYERFLHEAAAAGADGVLILDLPPDEAGRNSELRRPPDGLKMIRLIAPTTPPESAGLIAAAAEGFVYYVSREGVTGEQQSLADTVGGQVAMLRGKTSLPIAIGFGISTPEQAREAAEAADAVVVGSAIVRQIGAHGAVPDLAERIAAFVRPWSRRSSARAGPLSRRRFPGCAGSGAFFRTAARFAAAFSANCRSSALLFPAAMHKLPFTKMNGAGNDFVLLDNRDGHSCTSTAPAIARLCDRHRGVGADGVLVVEPARATGADFRMRYYNADGGEAEMCGNGARCFARFAGRLARRGRVDAMAFETHGRRDRRAVRAANASGWPWARRARLRPGRDAGGCTAQRSTVHP